MCFADRHLPVKPDMSKKGMRSSPICEYRRHLRERESAEQMIFTKRRLCFVFCRQAFAGQAGYEQKGMRSSTICEYRRHLRERKSAEQMVFVKWRKEGTHYAEGKNTDTGRKRRHCRI